MVMSKQQLRIGLIGLGGMANHHIRLLSQIEDAVITALCDVNADVLQSAGERLQVTALYRDYASIVQDPNVDCIISIVPNKFHAEIIELCIKHGKPLMTEKPFTATFAEAEALKRLYDASPIPCMVGFSYRYIPAFRYAKDLIEQGEIGDIRHLSVHYLQQWGAELFDTPYSWRFSKEMSGSGALGDLGAHMIDTVRYFGGEFRSVTGVLRTFVPERKLPGQEETRNVDVDDIAAFVATLRDGAVGVFTTSRNAVGFANDLKVTVFGTKGTIEVSCERPNELKRWAPLQGELDSNVAVVPVPEGYARNQLSDFLRLARGEDVPGAPTFLDGYINQKILDAIIRSADQGVNID